MNTKPLGRQLRWYLLGLLSLITVVNFVDRQAAFGGGAGVMGPEPVSVGD